MTAPCKADHLFWEALPDGLALYPLGHRFPKRFEPAWLDDEEILGRIEGLERPAVYLEMGQVELIGKAGIGAIVRLCQRARVRDGRLVLCHVHWQVDEVLRIFRLDRVPWWLVVSGAGVPGRRLLLPDPAWLSWNGGAVLALARTIAEGRDFALLPVLGDALEEAGCSWPDVLEHCRGRGRHVPACWVLGLLLAAAQAGASSGDRAG